LLSCCHRPRIPVESQTIRTYNAHSAISFSCKVKEINMRLLLTRKSLWLSFIVLSLLCTGLYAQQKQEQDEDFAKSVKEWTTKPEFVSPLVDHLPKANGIPSPKD